MCHLDTHAMQQYCEKRAYQCDTETKPTETLNTGAAAFSSSSRSASAKIHTNTVKLGWDHLQCCKGSGKCICAVKQDDKAKPVGGQLDQLSCVVM